MEQYFSGISHSVPCKFRLHHFGIDAIWSANTIIAEYIMYLRMMLNMPTSDSTCLLLLPIGLLISSSIPVSIIYMNLC